MSADLYTWLPALYALAAVGAIGCATNWQLKRPVSSPEAKLAKRRLFIAAVSLGILLVMDVIIPVIIKQLLFLWDGYEIIDSITAFSHVYVNDKPYFISFCGCAYCISTYRFVKASFITLCIVVLGYCYVRFYGCYGGGCCYGGYKCWRCEHDYGFLYDVTIPSAFVVWLLAFLYLLRTKTRVSLSAESASGTSHGRNRSRRKSSLKLINNPISACTAIC